MRRAAPLIAACAAVALLSTLPPWALAFDPEAWLVWGREALRLDLATAGGPSWKPLPVAVTTPLSLLGDATPWAWLVFARTAGLLALAGAAALAWRISGSRAAALTAVLLVALSPWWAFNTALGNSEGMLACALLWAVVAHLDDRRDAALLLALAAALLRPEVWPFLGLYAVWSWRSRPASRALAAGVLLAIPIAWCVPELLSSGQPFRAADAALGTPSAEAAARAGHPWLEVFRDAADLATLPVLLAFAATVGLSNSSVRRVFQPNGLGVAAARDRGLSNSSVRRVQQPAGGGVVRWLGVGALAWVALVSVMTAAGFAGTPRYSAPAAAVAAVIAATVTARHVALGLVLIAAAATLQLGPLNDQRAEMARRADLRESLHRVIDEAGGPNALRTCGPVRTDRTTTTTVAWHLDVPIAGLATTPRTRDAVLLAETAGWRLRSACGR
ncbi:MAG: hypothetical protein WKF96_04930 [Solirubrobacteraceae bacterium]